MLATANAEQVAVGLGPAGGKDGSMPDPDPDVRYMVGQFFKGTIASQENAAIPRDRSVACADSPLGDEGWTQIADTSGQSNRGGRADFDEPPGK